MKNARLSEQYSGTNKSTKPKTVKQKLMDLSAKWKNAVMFAEKTYDHNLNQNMPHVALMEAREASVRKVMVSDLDEIISEME